MATDIDVKTIRLAQVSRCQPIGRAVVLALIAVIGAGCGGAAPSASSAPVSSSVAASPTASAQPSVTLAPTPAADMSALSKALSYTTDDVVLITFTDWQAVLGPAPDETTVLAGLNDLANSRATAASSLLQHARTIRADWSFGLTDLAWQADYDTSRTPGTVFEFRDKASLDAIRSLIHNRSYWAGASAYGIETWSHRLEMSDWMVKAPRFMTNLGLDAGQGRLLVTGSVESLTALVQAFGAGTTASPRRTSATLLAAAMGSPESAVLSLDPEACHTWTRTAVPAELGSPLALGLALTPDSQPPVTVALLYASPAAASADLAARTAFANSAKALDGKPYSSTVLRLSNGRTAGSILLFDGTPAASLLRILSAVYAHDLPFAACP